MVDKDEVAQAEPQTFRSTSAGAAPQPQPVEIGEDGPELVSQVSDHKHRYQRFRVLGEQRDPRTSSSVVKCVVCNKEKGSRD